MYCVLMSLKDTIFVRSYAFPEWSLWRSICVPKCVFMCLQLLSSTCQTQLGPNPTCPSSTSDPLRFVLWIQRVGFSPWSKCWFGNNNPALFPGQSSLLLLLEAGPSTTLSPLTAGHEVMRNVTSGFSSDSKVKWKVYPCLNHKRKLLVLAEYLRKNGLP